MGGERQFEGVRAASASTIEIDFYYAGARRRERIKLKPSAANLKRAALHRAAILDAIANGTFDYATTFPDSRAAAQFSAHQMAARQTLGDYLDAWIDSKGPTIKASTAEGYRKIINGVLRPKIGAISLAEFRRGDARQMCEGIAATNKRIANILSVLRAALQDAVGDDLIDSNPIAGWTYARNVAPREEDDVDPFTPDEQRAILKALPDQGRNLIQFALWSGLRTSELVALQWNDIDFGRGEIRVRRATTQAARRQAETTKTRSGTRAVKLLGPAREALEAQKPHTLLAGAHVFHNPRTAEPWTGDQPIRKTLWQPALRRAGVRYRVPYQTRHTYASMMLSAGEHPMWVAQQMGHADWAMIRRVYGRWMPAADLDAGGRAEALFGSETGNRTPCSRAKNGG